MHLIVGLGNPGKEYEPTRHNIGFLTIDMFAHNHVIDVGKSFCRALVGEGRVNASRVVLAKPQTFMNESGWSALDLINWYKCEHDEFIVVYDDVDLPQGEIRIRERGSAGTHNGMRSIVYQLGYDDFLRVRVGIGKPQGERDMVAHVLGMPSDDDQKILLNGIKSAVCALDMIIAGDITKAQATYNKKAKHRADIEQKQPKPDCVINDKLKSE